ncbi:MAG: 50S ribosomal protein L17 [Patescibacteria group bacterium]
MRHRKKGKILGRKRGPRDALLRNQAKIFFRYGKINTTETKAKLLRSYVEKLITRGKKKNLANLRYLNSKLNSIKVAQKIVDEISPTYTQVPGGYTRITKLNKRAGDNAPMARLELIEMKDETKSK